MKFTGDVTNADEAVPVVASQTTSQLYNSGDGTYQAVYNGVTNTNTVTTYEAQLEAASYTKASRTTPSGNIFARYEKGDTVVNLTYFEAKDKLHVVWGPKTCDMPTEPVTGYNKVAEPSVSMLQLSATGLSLVFQLADGSFVIVDGGRDYDADRDLLWDFLVDHLPEGETKPRVTWVFSHIHNDHIDVAYKGFLAAHKNDMILDMVVLNFPDFATVNISEYTSGEANSGSHATITNKLLNIIRTNYPKAKIFIPHTGDTLYLPGCAIEFLYTHEDLAGTDLALVNNTSLVFRVTMGEKKCMVFADAEELATNFMYQVYGDYLKSDIMQVPHHGQGTASWNLYSAVDADVCLWSCGQLKFDEDKRMGGSILGTRYYNYQLRRSGAAHYHMSQTTTVNMANMSVSSTVDTAIRDALLAFDTDTLQRVGS